MARRIFVVRVVFWIRSNFFFNCFNSSIIFSSFICINKRFVRIHLNFTTISDVFSLNSEISYRMVNSGSNFEGILVKKDRFDFTYKIQRAPFLKTIWSYMKDEIWLLSSKSKLVLWLLVRFIFNTIIFSWKTGLHLFQIGLNPIIKCWC